MQLQLRLFGIPIVVTTAFWLTGLLLGVMTGDSSLIVPAVIVVFVAVLAHELGHALTARAFGAEPVIFLIGLGGRTELRGVRLGRGRTIGMTLAGPGAGFVVGAVAYLVGRYAPLGNGLGPKLASMMVTCTIGWGIVNLVPVLPLDGGVVLREILGPERARLSYGISGVIGLAAAIALLLAHYPLGALLFGMATVQSVRAAWSYGELRQEESARREAARRELDAASRSASAGFLQDAEARAGVALSISPDAEDRDSARRILARVAVERGQGMPAVHNLSALETRREDDYVLLAEALDVAGERAAAFQLLEHRVIDRPAGPALGALLRGLVAVGELRRAWEIGRTYMTVGEPAAVAELAGALHEASRFDEAGALFAALFDRTGTAGYAFEAARARSRGGDVEGAYAMLESAVLAGFGDVTRLSGDASLAALRDDPRFARLLARLPAS